GLSPIGSSQTSPYAVNWNLSAVGQYNVIAVATDDSGASATSIPIGVTVNDPPPPPPPTTDPTKAPLVQATTMAHQGAFRVQGGLPLLVNPNLNPFQRDRAE